MGHKVFIPVSDELIFDRPELISTPLRPYSENLACYHWMDIRLNPDDDRRIAESFHQRQISTTREKQPPLTIAA